MACDSVIKLQYNPYIESATTLSDDLGAQNTPM